MIVPSIDLMGGNAVQLRGGKTLVIDAGDPAPIADRFAVVGPLAVIDLDAALGQGDNRAAIEALCQRHRCRVGGGIRDVATAKRWLAAGAAQIILGTAARPEILRELPRERVFAALDAVHGEIVVDGWRTKTGRSVADEMARLRPYVAGFLVTFVEREGRMVGVDFPAVERLKEAAGDRTLVVAGGVTTAAEIARLDALGVDAQVGMALYSDALGLGESVAAIPRSDRPDGLIATLVVDQGERALGLCWSSRATLAEAIDTRRGIYHSRRRGRWEKGATSGATQRLLRVDLDCDRDAVRFVVEQAGAGFCHLDTASCFGPLGGVSTLVERLTARASAAPAGSYTARLLADPALLEAKLREEAEELAQAEGAVDVAEEAADLVYFAAVALARARVPWSAVEAVLDRRARSGRRAAIALPESAPAVEQRGGAAFDGLRRLPPDFRPARQAIDPEAAAAVAPIIADVAARGEAALVDWGIRFGDLAPGAPLVFDRAALAAARDALPAADRAVLERTAARIEAFAESQRGALSTVDVPVPGGRAGHDLVPIERVGCYAPGGRFPLPSSVLMTVIPARVAGARTVWVASPKPSRATLAAAAIAGADAVLAVGGAQAIAAFAHGAGPVPAVDLIVGPGNRYVTAAKHQVMGQVGIDMLAGPSELVVLGDATADPARIAADLLGQAEHDPDALPVWVTTDPTLIPAVEAAVRDQLADLPTAVTARAALDNGGVIVAPDLDAACRIVDGLAPEHLEIHTADANRVSAKIRHAGGVFVGPESAEVFGDYGLGPNHVLPTGGTARFQAGLSVATYLRARTWLRLDAPDNAAIADAVRLAEMEGLIAHARSAALRAR